MTNGVEIRLYDPRRAPPDWTEVMTPTQCAVLLRNRATSAPLSPAGQPFGKREEATCLVFDRFDAAQEYCETKVREMPDLFCEILDAHGRARPPLTVITHLVLAAPPLFWLDWRHQNTLILPTFLSFNCILLAMRFIYWHYGVRHRERERLKRLAAHRLLENGDA